jgi:hypothetical protein
MCRVDVERCGATAGGQAAGYAPQCWSTNLHPGVRHARNGCPTWADRGHVASVQRHRRRIAADAALALLHQALAHLLRLDSRARECDGGRQGYRQSLAIEGCPVDAVGVDLGYGLTKWSHGAARGAFASVWRSDGAGAEERGLAGPSVLFVDGQPVVAHHPAGAPARATPSRPERDDSGPPLAVCRAERARRGGADHLGPRGAAIAMVPRGAGGAWHPCASAGSPAFGARPPLSSTLPARRRPRQEKGPVRPSRAARRAACLPPPPVCGICRSCATRRDRRCASSP